MFDQNLETMDVAVDYGLSYRKITESLGVNGSVAPRLQRVPSWNVIDLPSKDREVPMKVSLFKDEGVAMSQILRQMAVQHLRPVTIHEFRAVILTVAGRLNRLVCLGTLWDCSQLLCWENNRACFHYAGHAFGDDCVFPTIYSTCPWNKR
jgi:hypothetical protein